MSVDDNGLCSCKNSHLYNKGEISCHQKCSRWELSPYIEHEKTKIRNDILEQHNKEQELNQRKLESEKERNKKLNQNNNSKTGTKTNTKQNSIIGGIIGWIMFILIIIFIFNLF